MSRTIRTMLFRGGGVSIEWESRSITAIRLTSRSIPESANVSSGHFCLNVDTKSEEL